MAGRSRGGLFAERRVQPLPALEEPYAFAFSVTRERFKLAASNGFPLDGRVCAVQSGLILPGAAGNLHRMGTHADIHDCGRDRLWHFLGRMEERLTLGTFLPLLGSYCSRLRHRSTGEREPLIKNSSSTPLLGQGLAPSGSARPPETAAVLQVSCGEVYLLLLRYSLLPIVVRGCCETIHCP